MKYNIISKERIDILPGEIKQISIENDYDGPQNQLREATVQFRGLREGALWHEIGLVNGYVSISNTSRQTYSIFKGDILAEFNVLLPDNQEEVLDELVSEAQRQDMGYDEPRREVMGMAERSFEENEEGYRYLAGEAQAEEAFQLDDEGRIMCPLCNKTYSNEPRGETYFRKHMESAHDTII